MNASLTFRTAGVTVAMLVAMSTGLAGQDSLSAARDLYAGAAYEDALLLLNRLRSSGPLLEEASAIEQYRAFCFFALGRSADAERAIEAAVQAQPLYQLLDVDVSPRLRSLFSGLRSRMLPAIVHDKYAAAKAAYDRESWSEAESGFKQILDILNDPDLAAAASQSPLSDMKMLAGGFYDLSAAADAAPPPPVVGGSPHIYVAGDPGVIPPLALRQFLPPYPTGNPSARGLRDGSLEVVINENGSVESAVMTTPLDAAYDRQAVLAALTWEYKPAMLNGTPVKFRRTVQITVKR